LTYHQALTTDHILAASTNYSNACLPAVRGPLRVSADCDVPVYTGTPGLKSHTQSTFQSLVGIITTNQISQPWDSPCCMQCWAGACRCVGAVINYQSFSQQINALTGQFQAPQPTRCCPTMEAWGVTHAAQDGTLGQWIIN